MGPIARTQAVFTPNFLCQPSSDTSDSSFHATNSPIHPLHAHEPRFWAARWPKYGPYSPWRFRLVDQQPASGLLDLGILVPSSAILPLAMLEPKYSMVPRLLCSLRALRASPDRSPCSNDPAKLRIVMMLDQNSSAACMERHPVAFTVPIERRPKKTWGLLRQIQPRMALSKPMRWPLPPKILKWTAVKIQLPVSTPGLARRSRLLLRNHRAPAPAPAQVLVLMAMLVNSNGTAACTAATTTS